MVAFDGRADSRYLLDQPSQRDPAGPRQRRAARACRAQGPAWRGTTNRGAGRRLHTRSPRPPSPCARPQARRRCLPEGGCGSEMRRSPARPPVTSPSHSYIQTEPASGPRKQSRHPASANPENPARALPPDSELRSAMENNPARAAGIRWPRASSRQTPPHARPRGRSRGPAHPTDAGTVRAELRGGI